MNENVHSVRKEDKAMLGCSTSICHPSIRSPLEPAASGVDQGILLAL